MLQKRYWSQAVSEIRDLRRLVFAALMCALSVYVGALYVVVGDNLRVYFTFYVTAVGCAVYGPVLGVIVAAITDTLTFFMFPSGPYFPGYMLGEMVAAFIYGCFLYRRKITVLRIFGARFLVNYFVNVGLGCLWSQILYGKGYIYYLIKSLVKNSLMLPVEVMVMGALFAVLIPVFSRMGLLPAHDGAELRRLTISRSAFVVFGLDCIIGAACSLYYSTTVESGVMIFRLLGMVLLLTGVVLLVVGPLLRRKKDA